MSKSFESQAFSRNIGIITEAEQTKLHRSTVTIAGMGGIGSNVAMILARMGVGKFRIADFDRFEPSNINRQYGAFADTIDQLKVDVVAHEIRRINPTAEVVLEPKGYTHATADKLLNGADVAVDAIDFYAIDAHLDFHRDVRRYGLFIVMGSPIGFGACLQVFDPNGMSIEDYCGIERGQTSLEKQLRYACGVVPNLAHIDYFDVSRGTSNTNFLKKTGPSMASATAMAAGLAAGEVALILLNRRKVRAIPHTFQFDPYTYRYEKVWMENGMKDYEADRALSRIQDRSSLIPLVVKFLYKKKKTPKVKIGSWVVHYEIEGSGENLLLINPLGADSSIWAKQVQELSKSHRVITYDITPADAKNPPPPVESTSATAEILSTFLKQTGVAHTNVLGLALGGLVAQQIAVQNSQLIDRIILISSYAYADDRVRAVVSEWQQCANNAGMEELFDLALPSLFSAQYLAENAEEVDKLKTFFRLNLQLPNQFVAQSSSGLTHDARTLLVRISQPVLLVHGGQDAIVNRSLAEELVSSVPNGVLKTIDTAGHFLHWEQPEALHAEILSFLLKGRNTVASPGSIEQEAYRSLAR